MAEAERVEVARSVYRPAAGGAAVRAERALGASTPELRDDASVVTLSQPVDELAEVLLDELCNHALYETILRERGGGGA